MKAIVLFLFIIFFFFNGQVISQTNFNYSLSLVPVSVSNLPGLHSYAYAQSQGKWIIIGGRKDGLHARQPFNAFPSSQNNTDIYVVDVQTNQLWSASVNSLQSNLAEQLQSTNMNFYQVEDTLYIIGGYGFSVTSNNHITYPFLTTIIIPDLINAIRNNQPIVSFFKQIQDNRFAITGGHLKKLENRFYLVGGHRFDGRYNPMGNPTYTQTYSNQIRKFSIGNSGTQLSYSNYSEITDPVHLRRRDYNLLPQIFPNGEQGLTISSGVFQINADLPFLYPVDIKDSSYYPITGFNQYLSNYHCPVACMYDSISNNMHSIFFGGISQYYYQNGALIQDNQVPFVKTISRVTRDANSNLTEYQLPVEMPSLKGAGAEFIPNLNLPHYSNKVFKLNDITQTSFMIGHILGGIQSSSLNPFSNNQTNFTSADNTVYEVWLNLNPLSNTAYQIDGSNPYNVIISPNPFEDVLNFSFNIDKVVRMNFIVSNSLGQILKKSDEVLLSANDNKVTLNTVDFNFKDKIFVTFIFDNKYYITKTIIKK